jgi:hypothetical protein
MDDRTRLIKVRAGHVIAADVANQLAAPGFQPLRADGTIPRSIFSRKKSHTVDLGRLRRSQSQLLLHGAFHGSKVIAHPPAREKYGEGQEGKKARRALPGKEETSECRTGVPGGILLETICGASASFYW